MNNVTQWCLATSDEAFGERAGHVFWRQSLKDVIEQFDLSLAPVEGVSGIELEWVVPVIAVRGHL